MLAAKIEIKLETQNLNGNYSCCVEQPLTKKSFSKNKPSQCSFIALHLNKQSNKNEKIIPNLNKIILHSVNTSNTNSNEMNLLASHLTTLIMTRHIIIVLIFFLVTLIAFLVWYKTFLSKKIERNASPPQVSLAVVDKTIGSLTEKQLKVFNQNSILNPKKLNFNRNPNDSPSNAPPTYNECIPVENVQ